MSSLIRAPLIGRVWPQAGEKVKDQPGKIMKLALANRASW